MENIECHLPTFEELTVEQINTLNENSFVVFHRKGDTIFRQDMPVSHVVYIKSGLVKIYKNCGSEKTHILKIATSGDFIGLISVFYGTQYQYSASALEPCEIVLTDINVFKNIIRENGHYALHIMHLLSIHGQIIFDKLINISLNQVPGRIANIILFFSSQIYKSDSFDFPLSRQELADLIASTKESVSRTLMEFKNDKIIEIDERKIVIKSMELMSLLSRIG